VAIVFPNLKEYMAIVAGALGAHFLMFIGQREKLGGSDPQDRAQPLRACGQQLRKRECMYVHSLGHYSHRHCDRLVDG
jgi:hypothetical protein